MQQKPPFSNTEQRLDLFVQVCQAIQHAHQKGIIHRDIKPSNILVADHDGVPVPKIIDFGIAKATTGQTLTDKTVFTALEQFIGTPAYMSPEQAKLSGLDIDTRSDIYSLGVLLYELLTGKTPFDARRLFEAGFDEIRRIIREEEPQRPSQKLSTLAVEEQTTTARFRQTDSPRLFHLVCGDLDWIVMKCLEKDRNRRYETANGLASDLQRHIHNEPVLARPPSQIYRFQKLMRRNKLAFAAGTAVGTAVLVGLAVSTYLFIRERQAHDHALAAEQKQRELRQEAENETKKAKIEAERATKAEALAEKRANTIFSILQEVQLDEDVALAVCSNAFGPEDPKTIEIMSEWGWSFARNGRWNDAIRLQEQMLGLSRKVLGSEKPETITAMQLLAFSYHGAGRRDEALQLREQVLALSRKVNGPEDPFTINAMSELAESYNDAGRRDEAFKLWKEVLPLLRKAAEQGNADAQNKLGRMYDNGEGVAKDAVEAAKWYRKSAEQGNADAQNNLAYCYTKGAGVEKDFSEAARWFRRSAEQGNADAKANLARLDTKPATAKP